MALICTVSATLTCQHLEWADYVELTAWDNYPYLAFVAEGRIGNAVSGGGTHEIDVGYTTGGPFLAGQTADYPWGSGQEVSFTLTYDSVSKLVSFNVGGTVVSFIYAHTQSPTEIIIRTRSNADGQIMHVYNLVLDGVSVSCEAKAEGAYAGQYVYNSANPGLDLIWITGGTLTDGFTLTGKARMTWVGSPSGSVIAFQIKVGEHGTLPPPTPPPPPVGGEWIPIDKLQLLPLWTSLASTIAVAASLVGIKRIKKRQD